MTIEERIMFLKRVEIFQEATLPVLEKMARNLEEVIVEKNERILLKGEPGDAMYIILEGKVKVHDEDYVFCTMKAGDVFGKYYLIDHQDRSATVTALERSHLFRFKQQLFDELTKQDCGIYRGMLKALVKRLREMNVNEEKLAELNATKDKFFSIIAHDLRSPISTMISFSELLATQMDTLTQDQIIEIIQSQKDISWQSLKLLDNLLQWASLQTGRLTVNPAKFNISEIVEEVIEFNSLNAKTKEITMIPEICGEFMVYADQNMIRTIILNLISNAIKFTPRYGSITVIVRKKNGRILISIKDTGVGMSQEFISRLFNLGQSQSTRGTENEKGTGLGLILCKEFVQRNGGTLSIESKFQEGSTFTIELPAAE